MENGIEVKSVLPRTVIDEHLGGLAAILAAAPEMRRTLEAERAGIDAQLEILDRIEGKTSHTVVPTVQAKRRGRPPGVPNKPKIALGSTLSGTTTGKRGPGRPRKANGAAQAGA